MLRPTTGEQFYPQYYAAGRAASPSKEPPTQLGTPARTCVPIFYGNPSSRQYSAWVLLLLQRRRGSDMLPGATRHGAVSPRADADLAEIRQVRGDRYDPTVPTTQVPYWEPTPGSARAVTGLQPPCTTNHAMSVPKPASSSDIASQSPAAVPNFSRHCLHENKTWKPIQPRIGGALKNRRATGITGRPVPPWLLRRGLSARRARQLHCPLANSGSLVQDSK
ncbi:hypothetical protein ACCO45_012252 [Purpureocillium lilacinum]|uniref:Uncharacterized protein n=1 Tax=Purpureocillium lilacinum TaxID=33203 RepID=A0ACC4DFU5_PURLI